MIHYSAAAGGNKLFIKYNIKGLCGEIGKASRTIGQVTCKECRKLAVLKGYVKGTLAERVILKDGIYNKYGT